MELSQPVAELVAVQGLYLVHEVAPPDWLRVVKAVRGDEGDDMGVHLTDYESIDVE